MRSLCLLLLVAGCVRVGPDFRPPGVAFQECWLECIDEKIVCACEDPLAWWTQFNDPTLDWLIQVAVGQNLGLQAAGYRICQARAELGFAKGEWFPQLQEAVATADRFKRSKNAPGSRFAEVQFWNFQVGLLAAWELDFWGRFARGIESAGEDYLASISNYQDVMVLLLSEVATNYILMRTIDERIDILMQNIAIQERSLQIVQARFNAGAVTELDVQQAKTLLFGSESRLPPLQAQRRSAQNALGVLLGTTPDCMNEILAPIGSIPKVATPVSVAIPEKMLLRRPDLRVALHLAASQSARIGIAISDLLPRISLNGFIGFNTSTSDFRGGSGKLFEAKSLTYIFGPSVAWPILNYGRLKNRVRVEVALFEQRVLDFQNQVLIAYQEVEDGLITYLKSKEEVEKIELSVKAAVRSTDLARTQYVEGIADYTRVLNAEEARLEEEERLVITRGTVALSLIATYKALGGGWEAFCCYDPPSYE